MPNQLATARVSELKADIEAIAQCPKAGEADAARFAAALVACYPGQQSNDPMVARAYARQLTERLRGADIDVLAAMINPKGGLVARQKFLPSIAEVSDFIDEKMDPKRARIGWYLDEIKRIEERENEPQVPKEQREAQAERAKETMRLISEAGRKMKLTSSLRPVQQHDPEKLMRGLENLQALKG